ncbi:hypothetical protein [Desulfovulcanus sp.]
MLYGPRQVGKTTLISSFLKKRKEKTLLACEAIKTLPRFLQFASFLWPQ